MNATVASNTAPAGWGPWGFGVGLALASAALLLLGLFVGSQGLDAPGDLLATIVWEIRLPRSAGAWLVGALLGLAGAVAQGLFRNPLADPYLLGGAAGAAFGVTLALVLALVLAAPVASSAPGVLGWAAQIGLTSAAFVGAVVATALALALAGGLAHTPRLLLAGVVVGVVLGAASSGLLWHWPQLLAQMQSFLLGSTSLVGARACVVMAVVLVVCLAAAALAARALDVLALGEATAQSLGVPLAPLRLGLVAVIGLATGAAVAQAGLVAFVGLAAPHIVRSRLRVSHRALLPLSALVGGALLLLADLLARGLLAPTELPVGVLTALAGGGYLLWRLRRDPRSGARA